MQNSERKTLEALRRVQEFLAMPAASTRQPRFLERAALVVDVASKYPQFFVGHGMTADFIDQLQLALDQIRSAGISAL